MRHDRRRAIPVDAHNRMLVAYADGKPTHQIAERFGVSESYIRKAASRAKIRKNAGAKAAAEYRPSVLETPPHLRDYWRARRDFHVPPHLEPTYTKLLIAGNTAAEAAEQLGLVAEATGQPF